VRLKTSAGSALVRPGHSSHGAIAPPLAAPRPAPASFEIPGRLPSTNEVSWIERSHWSKGAALRKKIETDIGMWILVGQVPHFPGPVTIRVDWFEKDCRRDRDNIRSAIKFILDALIATGRIVSDSQRFVKDITDGWHEPTRNARVVVTITALAA
jgi:Holliday junction resolvase RusA-like endonuclease